MYFAAAAKPSKALESQPQVIGISWYLTNAQLEQFSIGCRKESWIFWFYLTLLCDWPRKLARSSQPIRSKTTNYASSSLLAFTLTFHWLVMM